MGFRDVRRRQCPPELADDLTNNTLADKELLAQYKRIEQLSNEDKYLIKRFINSFLLSAEIQKNLVLWFSKKASEMGGLK